MTRITRVEVIDENGRSYVNWEEDNDITLSYQDDGRTLKVFVNTVKPKSPVEEAYKEVYGWYPPTTSSVSNYEDNRWRDFQNGYNAAYEEKVVEKETEREMIKRNLKTSLQELANGDVRPIDDVVRETKNQQVKELIRESLKWCEENPDESVEDYLTPQERGNPIHKEVENEIEKLQEKNWHVDTKTNLKPHWEPKPQTPEQTAQSLKEAFVKAQQTENWKETQKLIDEEDNDKNFKNSLDLIKEWGEKNKPPTLYEILMEWWINHLDMEQSDEEIIDGLVDIIDKKFIPPSRDRNGYEWEKCLKMMRDKLR